MRVKASQDLGALGAAEGPPSDFKWTPPSPVPSFLPWLVILVLLLARSNRTAAAWLIWLPLGGGFGLRLALGAVLSSAPATAIEMFGDAIVGLTFGLGAVWLLGNFLARLPRASMFFLGSFIVMAVAILTVVGQAGLEAGPMETIPVAIVVCVVGTGMLLVLTLAGLITRRRYRPARLCAWVALLSIGLAALISSPFAAVAMFSGQNIPIFDVAKVIGAFGVGAFLVLLPFLVLSFACALYRERLKGMLHLGPSTLPPLISPGQETGSPQIPAGAPTPLPVVH